MVYGGDKDKTNSGGGNDKSSMDAGVWPVTAWDADTIAL